MKEQHKISSLYSAKLQKVIAPVLFIIAVVSTLILLPHKSIFKYKYTKGQPWKYEDLISNFDFPIYKSQLTIEKEKDSIINNQIPYFKYYKVQEKYALNFFDEDFSKLLNMKSYSRKDSLAMIKFSKKFKKEINAIYKRGIIRKGSTNHNKNVIRLFRNEIAKTAFKDQFYTEKQAYLLLHRKLDSLSELEKTTIPNLPIDRYIESNIKYDKKDSEKMLSQQLEDISPVKGMIKKQERIISKGEPIGSTEFAILESLRKEFDQSLGNDSHSTIVMLGQFILILIIFISLYLFFLFNSPEILLDFKHLLYILLMPEFFIVLTAVFVKFNINIYLIPFAILPIITANFHNSRIAFFHHISMVLILSFIVPEPVNFIFTQLIVGFIAVISMSHLQNRRQLLQTVGLIIAVSTIIYVGFSILREGNFFKIDLQKIGMIIMGGIFILIAYPLVYLFERIFGYLSDISLLEMSDLNHPLLKELSEKAPGTFQHSLQVANISEAVASKINANPMLTRVGALFHDIGKIKHPQYFTENQLHDINPHDNLSPEKSAQIIKCHVSDGIKLAKKHNVPEVIQEFIKTHHGTRKIAWFLHAEKKIKPEDEINLKDFCYPGPQAKSKEAAIVMFVDSVEAAAKSLKTANEESLSMLVENIIDKQIKEKQVQKADITFAEIEKAKKIIKNKLINIYHLRIAYPKDE